MIKVTVNGHSVGPPCPEGVQLSVDYSSLEDLLQAEGQEPLSALANSLRACRENKIPAERAGKYEKERDPRWRRLLKRLKVDLSKPSRSGPIWGGSALPDPPPSVRCPVSLSETEKRYWLMHRTVGIMTNWRS